MGAFPITGHFAGDCTGLLIMAETDDTMESIAQQVAGYCVGIRVPRPSSDHGYEVLLDGEPVPAGTTLGQLLDERPLRPLQWLDVRFRSPLPS
jgi:hypothetical protein